ncbi:MAG: RHS repeat-associated core domain-containing protein, partial [Pseudomonadota bacterium]
DKLGNFREGYSYSGYGETTVWDAAGKGSNNFDLSVDNHFLFQGQWFNPTTGLYTMGAREYKPQWGRWLSPDPIGIAGGTNLYAFVGNMPLTFADPLGLKSIQNEGNEGSKPGLLERAKNWLNNLDERSDAWQRRVGLIDPRPPDQPADTESHLRAADPSHRTMRPEELNPDWTPSWAWSGGEKPLNWNESLFVQGIAPLAVGVMVPGGAARYATAETRAGTAAATPRLGAAEARAAGTVETTLNPQALAKEHGLTYTGMKDGMLRFEYPPISELNQTMPISLSPTLSPESATKFLATCTRAFNGVVPSEAVLFDALAARQLETSINAASVTGAATVHAIKKVPIP